MAGSLDVLLRGAILVLASLVLGGVVWSRLILRAGPGRPPAAPTTLALRIVAVAAGLTALAQSSTLLVALTELRTAAGWPLADFLETTFAATALTRIALALAVGYLAQRLSRGPAAPLAWHALGAGAMLLVGSSAVLSHAVARVEDRTLLLMLDGAHQVAAAVWIGGLAQSSSVKRLRIRSSTGSPRMVR